jgi:NAD(P)-dependent dehydrogenase (short-subunit alcohol dehydrogenase family)
MGTIAISGCATGIGAATRKVLEDGGARIIGVDLRGTEVVADLATHEGRSAAIRDVLEQSGGVLDGVVLCAGLGGHIGNNSMVASVNYFGASELLDGWFPALVKGQDPAAVVICSNSAQLAPNFGESKLVAAMLSADEAAARKLADEEFSGQEVYMHSKHAIGVAVRRRATEWGESGVRLNAVAPGPIMTPLLQGGLDTPGDGDLIRAFKIPVGRYGTPEEVAGVIDFLMAPKSGFVHGAVWYVDGGADASIRPDRY